MEKKFPVIVIGAGPAGYVAALRLAHHGIKVALCDRRKTVGGSCLHVGCIPSKALLHSSYLYHELRSHELHGIHLEGYSLDFSMMMRRQKEVVEKLTHSVTELVKRKSIVLLEGEASFLDEKTISLQGESIRFDKLILATGSKPIELSSLPFDGKKIISSDHLFSLQELPKRVAIIGGGVIGVEFASVFSRLGVNVTVLEMLERICPGMDDFLVSKLKGALISQGINFQLGAKVVDGAMKGEAISLFYESSPREKREMEVDLVLVAVGRKREIEGLHLERIGLSLNKRGELEVNNAFETCYPHIYAIGDLIDGPMLAHKASEEGVVVADRIAGVSSSLCYMAIPNIVYTHPEAVSVGLSEREVEGLGRKAISGVAPLIGNPRARCCGDTVGFVKVVGDKATSRLLGAHLLAPYGSEMIGEMVMALQTKRTLHEIAHTPHGHPTFSEAIKEAALQAIGEALHL